MLRDKKGFLFRRVNSCLAFAMCLIMGLPLASADTIEFLSNPSGLFQNSKAIQCAVVNIHSLYKGADGKTLHQAGVGWVTFQNHYFGIVTPFHVVVNAEIVVAECRGQYFQLQMPVIDTEKDIAHFYFMGEDEARIKKYVTPLLLALGEKDSELKEVFKPTSSIGRLFYLNFSRTDMNENLFGLMLGMGSFGVAGAIDPTTDAPTVIMSPVQNDLVQALVDKDQSFIKNTIRVENMGIRPGLSGSALFGIPDIPFMTSVQNNTRGLSTPIELIPKVIFGMITKTRLNGAETVALSIGDIYDFLEERVLGEITHKSTRDLRVNYEQIENAKGEQLKSYISLHPEGDRQFARVWEYCSGEYKNSAESVLTDNKKLKLLLSQNKPTATDGFILKGISNNPESYLNKKRLERLEKSGGGEYGEGGDGFLSTNSEFLTSTSQIGKFDFNFDFNNLEKAPSFGLYLSRSSCKTRGLKLIFGRTNKIIHTVNIPGEKPVRMTSFEDLRHFNKKHKKETLFLLSSYGSRSQKPFFTQEMKDKEVLKIPLQTAQTLSSDELAWKPGNRKYLKQKLIIRRPKAPGSGEDGLQVSKDSLKLAVNLNSFSKLKRAGFQDRLLLQYANNQWQASIAIGLSCRMEFSAQYFTQVNPYYVEYDDGKNKLTLDLNSHDRFIAVNLEKSECAELKDLALTEIEVYLIPTLTAVIGTHRTALVPLPLDLELLKKTYLLPTGVKK